MRHSLEQKFVSRFYWCLISMMIIRELGYNCFHINSTVVNTFVLLAQIGFIYYFLQCKKYRFLVEYARETKVVYSILVFVVIGMVIRGNWTGGLKSILLHISISTKYFMGVLILLMPNYRNLDVILDVFYKTSLFVIPMWLFSPSPLVQESFQAESIGIYLPFFSAILLGFSNRLTYRQRIVSLIIYVIYTLLMVLNARRTQLLFLSWYGLMSYFCVAKNSLRKRKKGFVSILIGTLVVFLMCVINSDYLTSVVGRRLNERAKDDSRSGVEALWMADFTSSPMTDWVFGRGMDGTYFQPVTNQDTGEIIDDRDGIETAWMDQILKGGIIYLAAIAFLLIKSMTTLLKSKNYNLKYMGG